MPTAELCVVCHKQVHALYTNEELSGQLHSVEALRADPRLAGFIRWIRKQPASALPRVRKSRHVRERR